MSVVRPRHLLRLLLLLLLLVARRVWSSATNHMTMQKPQWTAGGQLLDSLITEQFSVSSACRCRSSCLARPECLSVSVTALQDGRFECRLSDHRGHPALLQPDTEHVELFERPGRSRLADWCQTRADCVTAGAECSGGRCTCVAGVSADGEQCRCGETYSQPDHGGCLFRDCAELRRAGATLDGDYLLHPEAGVDVWTRCDMTTDGGGWTRIQRRSGRKHANAFHWKSWAEFTGPLIWPRGSFWMGNRWIRLLTASEPHSLRVELESVDGETAFAQYGTFSLSSEEESFALHVGEFSDGGAGDALSAQSGFKFATRDRPNGLACVEANQAGWWTDAFCEVATNLNGHYNKDHPWLLGPVWATWRNGGQMISIDKTEMLIRPKSFQAEGLGNSNPSSSADGQI